MLADSFGSLMYESNHPCFSDIMCHYPNLETAKVLEFFFLCESENYPRSGCYTVSDVSFSCRDYQFSITIRIKNDRLVHDDPDKTKVKIMDCDPVDQDFESVYVASLKCISYLNKFAEAEKPG